MTLQITCIRINRDTWPEIYMMLIYILIENVLFIYFKLFITFNLQWSEIKWIFKYAN